MTTIFTTTGPIRQGCRHAHRTERAAARCIAADHRGCERWGGYSDRVVVELPATFASAVRDGRQYGWLMDAGSLVTGDVDGWNE